MKIGIPRALLYFKNEKFWTTLFENMGVDYIISPETNKDIILKGSKLAIDETCLPTKLMLGHIEYLLDKCDYIFVPRIEFCKGYQMCTKFLALPDLIANTFRDKNIKILYYNIGNNKIYAERKAILKMGKFLGVKKSQVKVAYILAKQAQNYWEMFREQSQNELLESSKNKKILLVAHAYNVGDAYVGKPIISAIKKLGCDPIIAEFENEKVCIDESFKISKTMPWAYNRHLVGAIEILKDKIDGIILLTTFPCGPDSMVNDLIVRRVKDKPIITLTVDTQDGTAGMETRLESFVDILTLKNKRGKKK